MRTGKTQMQLTIEFAHAYGMEWSGWYQKRGRTAEWKRRVAETQAAVTAHSKPLSTLTVSRFIRAQYAQGAKYESAPGVQR